MKKIFLLAAAAFVAAGCAPKTSEPREKLLIAGSWWDSIAIIDKATKAIEWTYTLPDSAECNSVELTPCGRILFSYKEGARLIDRQGNTVWDYTDVADSAELQTATKLADGGVLLAICGNPARIVELDTLGQVRKEVTYDLGIPVPHAQFRRVAKSANGNYLIPVVTTGKLLEVDGNGTLVKEYEPGGNPFAVEELASGDLLVPIGDGHALVIVERATGNVTPVARQHDIEGVELQFVAQSSKIGDNYLISNWFGHIENKTASPQLIEIDPQGKVVWSFDDKANVQYISAFWPFTE